MAHRLRFFLNLTAIMKLIRPALVVIFGVCLLLFSILWITKELLHEEKTPPSTYSESQYKLEPYTRPMTRQKLEEKADRILVIKNARLMYLMNGERVIKMYRVSLGPNPIGHKAQEGDGRTPEGVYQIDYKNPQSVCYLSLHISYPNEKDRQNAANLNIDPGKDIMIHGLPNEWGDTNYMPDKDWTFGCIAVNNDEMYEIWHAVEAGTLIEIRP